MQISPGLNFAWFSQLCMLQAFEEVEQLRVDAREAEEKLQVTTRVLYLFYRN